MVTREENLNDVWSWIPGYVGCYQVNPSGDVRSVDRIIKHGNGVSRLNGRILKHRINEHGYHMVALYKNGSAKNMKVHRLVADAFLEKDPNRFEINHKDGDKSNNKLSNLEWCTRKENIRHSIEHGLRKPPTNKRAVRRSDGVVFESISDAARELNTSSGHICDALRGVIKTANGYSFEYVD